MALGSSMDIAIIGGGLAGSVLMNALLAYPQYLVSLYEANRSFEERGASVGLSENAIRALQHVGLGSIPEKADGLHGLSFRLILCTGTEAGKTAVERQSPLVTVHRAALLKQLVERIPQSRVYFNKRLKIVDDKVIYFEDGTSATADLIIGADGIHSNVRRHPAVNPIFSGFWDFRQMVPVQAAIDVLGPLRVDGDNPRQHIYSGDRSFFLHDMLQDGDYVCIIGGGIAPSSWGNDQWKKTVSREWLNEHYSQWGEFGQKMLDLMCGSEKEVSVFLEWESAKAPKLYRDNLCMIGDAAHATTPWQGSGFSLAAEDSLILSSALGECTSLADIPAALDAYDRIMRPRGQRIIESSRGTGKICMGTEGLDCERMNRDLSLRWDFILDWDTAGAVKEAVTMVECSKVSP